jgi:hypothetical protein
LNFTNKYVVSGNAGYERVGLGAWEKSKETREGAQTCQVSGNVIQKGYDKYEWVKIYEYSYKKTYN